MCIGTHLLDARRFQDKGMQPLASMQEKVRVLWSVVL